MSDLWVVPALRWYPRKSPTEDTCWVSRKNTTVPQSWEDDGFGDVRVPVIAKSKEDAIEKVKQLEQVERLLDKPVVLAEVVE